MNNASSLTINKPVSVWNKDLSLEPKKFLFGIGKMLANGMVTNSSGVGEAALDTIDALGLREKAEELAWLLISRALTTAFFELVKEHRDLFSNPPDEEQLHALSSQFEEQMGTEEVRISAAFFNQPEALPLLQQVQGPLSAWLHGLGAQPADAKQIACRITLSWPCMKHGARLRKSMNR